jgi:hypothetical protein
MPTPVNQGLKAILYLSELNSYGGRSAQTVPCYHWLDIQPAAGVLTAVIATMT